MKHNLIFDGLSPHNGEYWYKCSICGQKDWIASYGTMQQLNFYNRECVSEQSSNIQQNILKSPIRGL